MNLVVVGLTHRTAGVDVRETYAVARDSVPDACRRLVGLREVAEAVLVSTCNRVEVYAVPADGTPPDVLRHALRSELGIPAGVGFDLDGVEAMRHLLRVSSSLDSMVVGEPQILGQVKEAYQLAQEAGTLGRFLDACFVRAFKAAKRIRTETDIARSAVSVGYVAVELAKTIFGDITQVEALLIGAGKMGILAAQNLAGSGARQVLVANRTYARGKELADRHGWTASAYEDLPFLLRSVDVVICSTGSPQPVLDRPLVEGILKARRYRPIFLIDIAVPRDIDPACGQLDNVYLYDIDDLEGVSRTNAEGRQVEVRLAEGIVAEELAAFDQRRRERTAAPTIKALRLHALTVARAEAEKALKRLPDLDAKGIATVQKLAEIVATRLVQDPIVALKRAATTSDGEGPLTEAVHRIFGLEEDEDGD